MSVWFFDRGLEALMMVNSDQTQALVWDRDVWEACGFTLLGMRGLPPAPQLTHDHLIAQRSASTNMSLALAASGRRVH